MAGRFNRSYDLSDVSDALLRVGEEVKNGSVVPNVVGLRLQFDLHNIRHQPMNSVCVAAQSSLRRLDRYLRNIQDCDILKSSRKQVIYKRGFAPAYVDDGCGTIVGRPFD